MKKMIRASILTLFFAGLVILPGMLSANGGGIYYSQGVSTGNISLVENKTISLEKEYLGIVINGDSSSVKVKYLFRNNGNKCILLYGFPVSSRVSESEDNEGSGNIEAGADDSITDFSMKFNGKSIKCEKNNISTKKSDVFDDGGKNRILNRWYVAKLDFPEGESTLDVSYSVENTYSEEGGCKMGFTRYSDREFMYTLSPSGSWGNGIVKEFNVSLDFSRPANMGDKLVSIEGLKFTKKGDKYTCSFTNFNMLKAAPLIIAYNVTDRKQHEEARELLRCDFNNADYDYIVAAASSSAEGHEIEKAVDCDPATAWVEGAGKGGTGGWITINRRFDGIAIVNGMTASKELYYKYGRVKKLRLELFYKEENKSFDIELKDRKYPEDGVKEKDFFTILWSGDGENGAVNAKITILDVYPGSEFRQVSISEIYSIMFKCE